MVGVKWPHSSCPAVGSHWTDQPEGKASGQVRAAEPPSDWLWRVPAANKNKPPDRLRFLNLSKAYPTSGLYCRLLACKAFGCVAQFCGKAASFLGPCFQVLTPINF